MAVAMVAVVGFLRIQFVQGGDIFVIFQHETGGAAQGVGSQLPDAQGIQGGGLVQSLGDGGLL